MFLSDLLQDSKKLCVEEEDVIRFLSKKGPTIVIEEVNGDNSIFVEKNTIALLLSLNSEVPSLGKGELVNAIPFSYHFNSKSEGVKQVHLRTFF